MIPVISVVGRSNTGKTTLIGKLVGELKRRGYRVAVIKHTAHGFELPNQLVKDTDKHLQAGAATVIAVAPEGIMMFVKTETEPSLDAVTGLISGADLVMTEGYKHGDKPKLEVARAAISRTLVCPSAELFAAVADFPLAAGVPCFAPDDTAGIADLIEKKFLRRS